MITMVRHLSILIHHLRVVGYLVLGVMSGGSLVSDFSASQLACLRVGEFSPCAHITLSTATAQPSRDDTSDNKETEKERKRATG
jgi:hypothetical protein